MEQTIRFGIIGVDHGHINSQVSALLGAGAEPAAFFAPDPDLTARFSARFPEIPLAGSAEEILEDESIQLVTSAAINSERAPLGIASMRHGKDFIEPFILV